MTGVQVDVVLRSYPVTTQTFHYQRLAELNSLDVLGAVWVESRADGHIDPDLEVQFGEKVRLIDELPMPSTRTLARHAGLLSEASRFASPDNGEGGAAGAVKQTLSGIRLGEFLGGQVRPDVLHASFSTGNLTIARAAAKVADIPYSTEVHSPLSWFRNPAWFRIKVAEAAVVAVISDYCHKRVISVCPEARDNIVEVHCGLPPREPASPQLQTTGLLTSVGGLVDKKGHDTFIRACAILGERGEVIGGGALLDELALVAERAGARVELGGARPHAEVLGRIEASRAGVVSARYGGAGDEDGLPVVLLEFLRAGVPAVSTTIAGIPHLLRERGTLAVEDDHVALAAAIHACAESPERPVAAREWILQHYDSATETNTLVEQLRIAIARRPRRTPTRSDELDHRLSRHNQTSPNQPESTATEELR